MALGFGFVREAQAFDVFIKRISSPDNVEDPNAFFAYLCTLIYKGQSPRTIHAGFGIRNLPAGRWSFKFEPCPSLERDNVDIDGSLLISGSQRRGNIFLTATDGFENGLYNEGFREYDLDLSLDLGPLRIFGDVAKMGDSDIAGYEAAFLAPNLNSENWKDIERNYETATPMTLTCVNEVVEPENQISYPDVSLLEVELRASERLTNPPSLSVEIENGQVVPHYISWGKVASTSGNTLSIDSDFHEVCQFPEKLSDVVLVEYIINLRSGRTFPGTYTGGLSLKTDISNDFQAGDEFATYYKTATCLFPNIFCDVLLNQEYGFGAEFEPGLIDFRSIILSNKHCLTYGYYWDDLIENASEFTSWATKQATGSLLYPVRINGAYGLLPENPELQIRGVFNDSNILKGSFNYSTIPQNDRDVNKVIIVYTDGASTTKELVSVVVQTKDSYFDRSIPIKEVRKRFPSITNREQAIDVAVTSLNSSIYQSEQISFSTDYQGLALSPADLIAVQQKISFFDYNGSGLIVEVLGDTRVKLDNQPPTSVVGYSAYIKNYSTGQIMSVTISQVENNVRTIAFTPKEGTTVFTPEPGDPILIYSDEITTKTYRVQDLNLKEEGVDIQAVNWTKDLFIGTSLTGYSEEPLDYGHTIRDDFYVISRE